MSSPQCSGVFQSLKSGTGASAKFVTRECRSRQPLRLRPRFRPYCPRAEPDLRKYGCTFEPNTGADLQTEPYISKAVLSDGGVYDNIGLETVWKDYRTVLVSDAGGHVERGEAPHHDWARHAFGILDIIDNQVRSLRKRQVIAAYQQGEREGAYWGILTNILDYEVDKPLPCPFNQTMLLARIPTRLKGPLRFRSDAADQLGLCCL
jgi:hypothetical protein